MSMTGVECKKGGAAFTKKFAGAEYSTKIDQFRRQWSELMTHLWERACSRRYRCGSADIPSRLNRGQARSHRKARGD
ncbi:hypothetical protein EU514_01525 [Pseudomonas fragi]|nr:hypothetical protein [Pseudomonas fragi]